MSLIIKGMEMPYCCVVCPFKEMYHDGLICKATTPHKYIPKFLHERYEKCPLVEVSTPHGELIDRDVLLKDHVHKDDMMAYCDDFVYETAIEDMPTIIKAEE